ncbi:MAG: hypothetical protein DWH81_01090 [Planctomycetota bacterium]|jgi:hypothetical protein|nr:MAG: hypothetical protein DWH81_01090 [Planctomycetota bacterium]
MGADSRSGVSAREVGVGSSDEVRIEFDTGRQLGTKEVNQTFMRSLSGASNFDYGDVVPLSNAVQQVL